MLVGSPSIWSDSDYKYILELSWVHVTFLFPQMSNNNISFILRAGNIVCFLAVVDHFADLNNDFPDRSDYKGVQSCIIAGDPLYSSEFL